MSVLDTGWIVLSENYYFPIRQGENRNILVTGTSGCGKSMSIVEPCILNNYGSLIIVDPKGSLQRKYAEKLRNEGYQIYHMDLSNPEKSNIGFNPLKDICSDAEILSLANMIVYADKTRNYGGNVDPYWDQQATELLSIILDLAINTQKKKGKQADLSFVNRYLADLRTEEDNSEFERRIYSVSPNTLSYKLFNRFKRVFTAERTIACIYSSLENAVGTWSCKEVEEFFKKESFDITSLAEIPSVLFLKISDSDESFYPLCTVIINYFIDRLFKYADSQENGMCRIPIQFVLDDYSSNIVIRGLPRYISTCRARNIGMMLIIQALSQLRAMHSDNAQTILNNCGHCVFFGTLDIDTAKEMSQRLNIPFAEALSFSKDNVAVFRRGYPPLTDRRYREDELALEYNMGQMERKRKQIYRYFADTRRKKEMEEGHGEMSE